MGLYKDLEEGSISRSSSSSISSSDDSISSLKKPPSKLQFYAGLIRRREWAYFLPAIIVFYSVIKEIKIGEPFLYQYHTQVLNYTAKTLNGEIHPYSAYMYLIAIIPIFLFTDIFLYKPVMYLEIIGQITYRFTLVFTNNLFSQQFGQGMYGIASASEIAFFSYIYGKLEKDQYQRLTSWTRAGTMAGRTGGYVVAQILILTGTGTYVLLNQVAFSFSCLALVFCFLMPRVNWRKLVERIRVEQESQKSRAKSSHTPLPISYKQYVLYRLGKLRSDFVKVYSNPFICKWSFWWAITTCMSLQISLYSQTLFGQAQGADEIPLNGFADAGYTFTATVGILLLNSLPINWNKWGETALVIISTLDAIFLYIYSTSTSAYPMYIVYIFYRSFYQVMITIAQWNIAKKMVCDSYGLVFGVNSFIALIMQSALTRIVSDKRGLGMQVRDAFLVYASLHALIAIIFLISVIYTIIYIASIASIETVVPGSKPKVGDVASELDFSSDSEDEFDSDEDKVPGMPTDTLAASFSASMSRKLSKPM
uniref:Uncharacterized protein n=1 Tax=Panagrolaimus sp. PS1159 TaxID=55785 RepID=A0AC35FRJ2_9BILA